MKRRVYQTTIVLCIAGILWALGRVAVRVVATNHAEAALAPYGGVILSNEEVDLFGIRIDYRDHWGRFDFARLALLRYGDQVSQAHLLGSPDMAPSELGGLPYLGDFQIVNFQVNTFSDAHCRVLGRVHTENLTLNSPFISEAGIRFLTKNRGLKVLSPGNFNLTPESAVALVGFEQLRGLHLANANTTAEAFAKIPASLRLIALTLPRTAGDAYIDTLARWQRMQTLRLVDTEMTIEGLERLVQFLPPGCTVILEYTTDERYSSAPYEQIERLSEDAAHHEIEFRIDPPD